MNHTESCKLCHWGAVCFWSITQFFWAPIDVEWSKILPSLKILCYDGLNCLFDIEVLLKRGDVGATIAVLQIQITSLSPILKATSLDFLMFEPYLTFCFKPPGVAPKLKNKQTDKNQSQRLAMAGNILSEQHDGMWKEASESIWIQPLPPSVWIDQWIYPPSR